tara:strand:- start:122 stop:778 length:657 start_codon:yes stop_codon:yes gene_type:complete
MTKNVDEQLSRELEYIETPVSNDNDIVNLNGPRMGISVIVGEAGERLSASKDQGGFEMLGGGNLAVTSMMGYQFEKRYLATNKFQALVEVITLVGGMEIGQLNPSLTILNGLRLSESNWEFGFGPTFKLKKMANGYNDENGNWHKENEWDRTNGENPHKIKKALDSRGYIEGDMGMIFAIGKTFQSGRLNIPFNLYYAPSRGSSIIGFSLGFNIQKIK